MERADEIYLIDMWHVVVREWLWFLATGVLIMLATFYYLHSSRSQWEATSWIQIGQVGVAPVGQDPKVEPILRVMERLQTPNFQDEVLKSVGVPLDAPEAALYRRSMKLEAMPYANLIKMHIRAYSQQDASQLASATVAVLHVIHEQAGATAMQLAHARLQEIETNLKDALADRDRLAKEIASGKSDQAEIASMVMAGKSNEIRSLEQARNELAVRLTSNYTSETLMPWPPSVPPGRAFPNTVLTLGLGALVALFFASLVAVARNALRTRMTVGAAARPA